MLTILLVVQIIIAVSMVIVILIQRSASDGLAGLGGGGGNSLISGRTSANILTKSTAILATAFMINSLAMATITARSSGLAETVIEDISTQKSPEADKKEPLAPVVPSVPMSE